MGKTSHWKEFLSGVVYAFFPVFSVSSIILMNQTRSALPITFFWALDIASTMITAEILLKRGENPTHYEYNKLIGWLWERYGLRAGGVLAIFITGIAFTFLIYLASNPEFFNLAFVIAGAMTTVLFLHSSNLSAILSSSKKTGPIKL